MSGQKTLIKSGTVPLLCRTNSDNVSAPQTKADSWFSKTEEANDVTQETLWILFLWRSDRVGCERRGSPTSATISRHLRLRVEVRHQLWPQFIARGAVRRRRHGSCTVQSFITPEQRQPQPAQ